MSMTTDLRRAISRRRFGLGVAAVVTPGLWVGFADAAPSTFDFVIDGGRVMDPESGFDGIANIGIRDGVVAAITRSPISGRRRIDARGLVVSPGFIDLHAHGQTLSDSDLQARDGVTTALELESGAFRVQAFHAKRTGQARINFGCSVSHQALRIFVATGIEAGHLSTDPAMGARVSRLQTEWAYPPFGAGQVETLRALVREEVANGALGVGLMPEYVPGASRDEVLAIFEEAAACRAPVFAHVRRADQATGDGPMAPIQEVIADTAATGASLHICHIGSKALGAIDPILRMIAGARKRGLDITTEVYPYTASSTKIGSALFDEGWQRRQGVDFGDIEWALTGERLTAESFARYRAENPVGWAIIHKIPETTVDRAISDPMVMIASDGVPFVNGKGHPRGAGSFSRVLGHYVRDRKLLPLMDALRKMTLMPAQRLEAVAPAMRRKGRISVGADADLTIFGALTVGDRATYAAPTRPSAGISHVLINGVPVVSHGALVAGVFPGQGILARR